MSFSLPAVKSSLGSSFFLSPYCVCLSSPTPCSDFLSPSLFLLPLSLGEFNAFFLKSPLFPLSFSVCQLISALQTAYKTHLSAAVLAESSRKVHILAKNPMNSTTYPKRLTDKEHILTCFFLADNCKTTKEHTTYPQTNKTVE